MEADAYGSYRSACISCNLFVIGVILFDFMILVCLLLMQVSQNSSTPSIFRSIVLFMEEGLLVSESDSGSESKD